MVKKEGEPLNLGGEEGQTSRGAKSTAGRRGGEGGSAAVLGYAVR